MSVEPDIAELRDRVLGHVRDDPEVRSAFEDLAGRDTDGNGDAVARVMLALADGERPDADDLDAVLEVGRNGDARLLSAPRLTLTDEWVWLYGRLAMTEAGVEPPADTDMGGVAP